jgi:hypothetical protein
MTTRGRPVGLAERSCMLNGRNVVYGDLVAVTPDELLAARLYAERAISFYSGVREHANSLDAPDVHEYLWLMNETAARDWSEYPDDWPAKLRPAVQLTIELGNSDRPTRELTFPTVHRFALELNYWLVMWAGHAIDSMGPDWQYLESMPEISDANALLCRLSDEWRSATAWLNLQPAACAVADEVWSEVKAPNEWERVFDLSWITIKRRVAKGKIKGRCVGSIREWQFLESDVPNFAPN